VLKCRLHSLGANVDALLATSEYAIYAFLAVFMLFLGALWRARQTDDNRMGQGFA